MVEPRMDRDRRRAESHSGTGEKRLFGTSPVESTETRGWDPYQVWREQVKQARDLAALHSRNTLPLQVNRTPAAPDNKMSGPRWRLRLAALLPRSSG